jgi:ABC-type branched-subunit amino acid transport system ATPase component
MRFLLPLASRVVVLNFGARIAEGTPDAVRSHPAVMEAYLGDAAAI